MKKWIVGTGALIGGLLTAALTGILYLGRQVINLPFVPYEIFNWIARELPGDLVTFGIDLMIDTMLLLGVSVVDTAKTAERILAIALFLIGGVFAGAIYFAVMKARGAKSDLFSGLIMGALFGLPVIAISLVISSSTVAPFFNLLWLALTFLAWGAALSFTYRHLGTLEREDEAAPAVESGAKPGVVQKIGRRQFLVQLGAATATITVLSGGLGAVLAASERRRQEQELADSMAHQAEGSSDSPFPNSNDPVMPVSGTRPEYTPIKDHYKVFLQAEPTIIDGGSWMLPITGLVDTPLMLTIDDIRDNYEPRHQYVTLTCISGRVGTDLISTTQWTGASVQFDPIRGWFSRDR